MKIITFLFFFFHSMFVMAQKNYLFIGTYTNKGSEGIYVYEFDRKTGKATAISHTDHVVNPSYLALSRKGKNVYAVNETHGKDPGMVSSFSFDKKKGELQFLNKQLTGGDDPCYLALDKKENWLTVGNYSSGNLTVFELENDGSILPYSQMHQHTGSSANLSRQSRPHVHATVFSPDGKYLYTPDLGLDKVMIYAFNTKADSPLQHAAFPFVSTQPGSGPRHMEFHPNKKFAYLVEEMAGAVSVFKYNNGNLLFVDRVFTHSPDYAGDIGSADIHLSPDGKFLYVSNRGDQNSISIFSVDGQTGKLNWIKEQSTLGKKPRNFLIDPSGDYLLVAHQDSDDVVIFKRDKKTGILSDSGERISVSMPVCLKMME